MITTTTDDELQGDNQNTRLESFSMCKHDTDTPSNYPGVKIGCRYKDYYGRCVLDVCYKDKNESPDLANKHWVRCICCGDPFAIPPNQVQMPICPKCTSILYQHLHYPQSCVKCGASIASPSSMPFTRLCDDCISKYLFNDSCWHWELHHEISTTPLDLP